MAVRFGPCCFCAKHIEKRGIDPCEITVETAGGKFQVWYCHGACFKTHLADLPDYSVELFEHAQL